MVMIGHGGNHAKACTVESKTQQVYGDIVGYTAIAYNGIKSTTVLYTIQYSTI